MVFSVSEVEELAVLLVLFLDVVAVTPPVLPCIVQHEDDSAQSSKCRRYDHGHLSRNIGGFVLVAEGQGADDVANTCTRL